MDGIDEEATPAFARGRIIAPGTEHQLGTFGLFPPSSAQLRTLKAGTGLTAKNAEPELLWISFAELCTGKATESDYSALAGQHSTWVIDGVPYPDADALPQKSADWKRLGTLVDILHERDTTLFLIGRRFPADMAWIAHGLTLLARVESTEEPDVEEISGS